MEFLWKWGIQSFTLVFVLDLSMSGESSKSLIWLCGCGCLKKLELMFLCQEKIICYNVLAICHVYKDFLLVLEFFCLFFRKWYGSMLYTILLHGFSMSVCKMNVVLTMMLAISIIDFLLLLWSSSLQSPVGPIYL